MRHQTCREQAMRWKVRKRSRKHSSKIRQIQVSNHSVRGHARALSGRLAATSLLAIFEQSWTGWRAHTQPSSWLCIPAHKAQTWETWNRQTAVPTLHLGECVSERLSAAENVLMYQCWSLCSLFRFHYHHVLTLLFHLVSHSVEPTLQHAILSFRHRGRSGYRRHLHFC